MATFDRLHFLKPAIESIFAQTYRDWELVVADDGSGEETRAYLKALADAGRCRIVWLNHSGLPGAVRNAAVQVARGEYIAFMDSDDLWLPGKLEAQVASLEAKPHCGWSCTGFAAVDAAGRRLSGKGGRHWSVTSGWILERLIAMETVIALPTVMVRRSLFVRAGGFDGSLRMCEDYDLWLRLAALSEVDGLPDIYLYNRRHKEHCGSDAIAFEDRARVLEKMLSGNGNRALGRLLRKERAKAAIGLARSHVFYGSRRAAWTALVRSPACTWRYPQWWFGACSVLARALIPKGTLRFGRALRNAATPPSHKAARQEAGAREQQPGENPQMHCELQVAPDK